MSERARRRRGLGGDPLTRARVADELCDAAEQLDGASREHLARLEPLREFTLPHRDPRYDDALER